MTEVLNNTETQQFAKEEVHKENLHEMTEEEEKERTLQYNVLKGLLNKTIAVSFHIYDGAKSYKFVEGKLNKFEEISKPYVEQYQDKLQPRVENVVERLDEKLDNIIVKVQPQTDKIYQTYQSAKKRADLGELKKILYGAKDITQTQFVALAKIYEVLQEQYVSGKKQLDVISNRKLEENAKILYDSALTGYSYLTYENLVDALKVSRKTLRKYLKNTQEYIQESQTYELVSKNYSEAQQRMNENLIFYKKVAYERYSNYFESEQSGFQIIFFKYGKDSFSVILTNLQSAKDNCKDFFQKKIHHLAENDKVKLIQKTATDYYCKLDFNGDGQVNKEELIYVWQALVAYLKKYEGFLYQNKKTQTELPEEQEGEERAHHSDDEEKEEKEQEEKH